LKVLIFFASALVAFFPGLSHAAEKNWARLTGCTLMENESNDGDSFHVKYQGKEFIFRLYFVDTCESSRQIPERVKEQAEALGITEDRVLQGGEIAKRFSHGQLAGRTFTVVTCWQDAKGASRLPRNYAFVLYGNNDEHDLASTLAQNGLVRIYGMPAEPPGPMTTSQFRESLMKLAASAKAKHLGVYGNPGATEATTTGLSAGAVGASGNSAASSSSSAPLSYLFPAKSKAPDVVDNPVDDIVSDFAVDALSGSTIVQGGVPEDDFSEIPGWKPPAKKKKKTTEAAVVDAQPDEIPD
jgi:endonuclease YncB( thermonuclease family)